MLGLVLAFSLSGERQDAGPKAEEAELVRIGKELLDYLNLERQLIDLPPLKIEVVLQRAAVEHNRKMMAMNQLAHEFPGYPPLIDRLQKQGLPFSLCGENVGWSESKLARFIHQGLMTSPPHRANILNPGFTHCGIAVGKKGDRYFLTQEFVALPSMPRNDAAEQSLREGIDRALTETGGKVAWIPEDRWLLRRAAYAYLQGRSYRFFPEDKGCELVIFKNSKLEPLIVEIASYVQRKGGRRAGIGVALNPTKPGSMRMLFLYFVAFRLCREPDPQ